MALLALGCGACLSLGSREEDDNVSVTAPRLLDQICADGNYTLEGAAQRTAGLTDDTCGFELGPGGGSVSFVLDTATIIDFEEESRSVGVLLVDLGADGPKNARWVRLEKPSASAPREPTTTLTVSSQGAHVGVIDVEVLTYSYSGSGCSH